MVTAAFTEGLRLFIHLPVYEFGRAFELYEVSSIPVYVGALQTALAFEGLPRFLAVSRDRQTFLELETRDVERCKGVGDLICPVRKAISRKYQRRSCAAALFLHQIKRTKNECTRTPTTWEGSEAIHLEERRWICSTNYTQPVVFQCETHEQTPLPTYFNGTGYIDVPRGCSAHSDEWIFQASFTRELRTNQSASRNWTIRDLPSPAYEEVTVTPEGNDQENI